MSMHVHDPLTWNSPNHDLEGIYNNTQKLDHDLGKQFWKLTDPNAYSKVTSLDAIVQALAKCNEAILKEAHREGMLEANLFRLIKAIDTKRTYYSNDVLGIITKFFLKMFCLWNNGDTRCIQRAQAEIPKLMQELGITKEARKNEMSQNPTIRYEISDKRYLLRKEMIRANLMTDIEMQRDETVNEVRLALFPWE